MHKEARASRRFVCVRDCGAHLLGRRALLDAALALLAAAHALLLAGGLDVLAAALRSGLRLRAGGAGCGGTGMRVGGGRCGSRAGSTRGGVGARPHARMAAMAVHNRRRDCATLHLVVRPAAVVLAVEALEDVLGELLGEDDPNLLQVNSVAEMSWRASLRGGRAQRARGASPRTRRTPSLCAGNACAGGLVCGRWHGGARNTKRAAHLGVLGRALGRGGRGRGDGRLDSERLHAVHVVRRLQGGGTGEGGDARARVGEEVVRPPRTKCGESEGARAPGRRVRSRRDPRAGRRGHARVLTGLRVRRLRCEGRATCRELLRSGLEVRRLVRSGAQS